MEPSIARWMHRPLESVHAVVYQAPEAPHPVLWHASALREFRGDGHIAALVGAGVSGIEALVAYAAQPH